MEDEYIKNNIINFQNKLSDKTLIIAVSKTKSPTLIMSAYNAGHRDFGENKVQDLVKKAELLPKDIRWHMIGHLQTNKVKYIIDCVNLIHAVDKEKLIQEINKRAKNSNKTINCLIQIDIADEETKFGWDKTQFLDFLETGNMSNYPNISITGLMGMATLTDDQEKIRLEFRSLAELKEKINKMNIPNVQMDQLSMGMSGDYQIAVEEGSTMVRIGTAIFGERIDIWKP